ncbi:hypothetical protein GGF42_003888, partial [Coemansia sp. RSA 2424]
LPLLITHLKKIGAVTTETSAVAGKQVMTVQLDFSGLDDGEEVATDYPMAEETIDEH